MKFMVYAGNMYVGTLKIILGWHIFTDRNGKEIHSYFPTLRWEGHTRIKKYLHLNLQRIE